MVAEQESLMPGSCFKRHIAIQVDEEGERPHISAIERCRDILGPDAIEKWFNIPDIGWMWAIGIE